MTQQEVNKQIPKGTIYVHNNPARSVSQINLYDLKHAVLSQYETQNLSNTLLRKLTGKNKISESEKEAFFSFYGGAGKWDNTVQEAISKSIQGISLPTAAEKQGEGFDNIYHALSQLKNNGDVKAIAEINSWLDKVIEKLSLSNEKLYSIANNIVIQNDLNRAINKGFFSPTMSISGENGAYERTKKEIFSQSQGGAIVFHTTSPEFVNQKNLIRFIHMFKQYLDNLQTSKKVPSQSELQIIYKYAEYVTGRMASLLGYAYQALLPSVITQQANALINSVVETGSDSINLQNPFVSIKYLDKKQQFKEILHDKTVSTRDIKIILNQSQPNSTTFSLELRLPEMGASVKYASGLRTGKTANIRIKDSSTLLGTLLHDIDNSALSAIYNIIANYKRKAYYGRQLLRNPITKQHYTDIWQGIKPLLLINGLVGQMTKDDFSYYFIASGRVYTVVDIIESIISGRALKLNNVLTKFDIAMAETPQLDPSQVTIRQSHTFVSEGNGTPWENALERSRRIVGMIQGARLKAGIRMKITEFT